MPEFKYRACDINGVKGSGVIYGESVENVARTLASRGLYPFRINKSLFGGLREKLARLPVFLPAVSTDERISFTLRFATLLKAGVPLIQCLDLVAEQAVCRFLKETMGKVKRRVEDGTSLSEAMSEHPSVFPPVYTAMVAAGEYSGLLDKILFRLVSMLERERDAIEKAHDVTRYPKIVMIASGLAITLLTWFVVPRYADIFERINIPLPAPTVALIWFSNFVSTFWPLLIAIAVFAFTFFRLWAGTSTGKLVIDRLLLKTPLVGDVILSLVVSRWADALSALVGAGVPIIRSLELSAKVCGNEGFSARVKLVAHNVAEGAGLAGPVEHLSLAPSPAPQMISAGEVAGSLDEALAHVSEYFEKIADRKIKRIAAYTEPLLIVGLSVLVLFLALAIFLPMWDMARLAKGA
ncbi:Type IV fimbrial assembly protein PilC [hydrothermal vent metagenome]|uniref:Type IV fimbrial assembly protein PilC n=1 Tax=hydrothermal vent metagenome TaxID=652676 RepID=A0A3B1CH46_9ZZZZ